MTRDEEWKEFAQRAQFDLGDIVVSKHDQNGERGTVVGGGSMSTRPEVGFEIWYTLAMLTDGREMFASESELVLVQCAKHDKVVN